MPYAHLKKKIPPSLDRRRKVTDDDRQMILRRYSEGAAVRQISRELPNISRRMITFIIHPERLEEMQKRNIENKYHLKYYNKDKWRETMREHRAYKKRLSLEGKI